MHGYEKLLGAWTRKCEKSISPIICVNAYTRVTVVIIVHSQTLRSRVMAT